MFTGLVEGKGHINAIQRIGDELKITIEPLFNMGESVIGESISVNGLCLTVTEIRGDKFDMDVSAESLSRSTLGRLKQGDEVNLERALRLGDRLGGHLVSGHIDGIGTVLKKEQRQRSWLLRIGINEQISRYIIEKGSIALDGISLTVNRTDEKFFEVNLIPQTVKETTIDGLTVGDRVNIEADMIGKYVEKFLKNENTLEDKGVLSGISKEKLLEYGFGE